MTTPPVGMTNCNTTLYPPQPLTEADFDLAEALRARVHADAQASGLPTGPAWLLLYATVCVLSIVFFINHPGVWQ